MNSTSETTRSHLPTVATVAVAGIAAAAMLSSKQAFAITPALTFANIPGTGDIKVLNFALALEQLEADLYVQALMRLTTGGTNALGTVITGLNLAASTPDVSALKEFGAVEVQHRNFLTSALGSAAIKPFKYNFNMQSLSRQQVLDLVLTAEKTGTSAYLGAIPYLATRTYLQTAGAIQGTEARHSATLAEIANILFSEGDPVAPLASTNGGREATLTPDAVLAAVSPFIVAS
jgi:hypothetical protein